MLKGNLPNKIIFLDVDGVINIPPYIHFNLDCLERLRKIILSTGAKVVISSSWREGDLNETKKHFPEWLHEHIIDETIRGYHYVIKQSSIPILRGNEIKHWVDRNLEYPWHNHPSILGEYKTYFSEGKYKGQIKGMSSNKEGKDFSYLILDDDDDMLLCQKDWFLQTNPELGITDEVVDKAITILNSID
jgi:hypothetical protein